MSIMNAKAKDLVPRMAWGIAAALLAVSPSSAEEVAVPALDGHRLMLAQPVKFAARSHTLDPKSPAPLNQVKAYLDAKSYISLLRIEGHTLPGPQAQALSEARARAVARALVSKGVDCKRLMIVGFGASKPVAAGNDPANERIEFVNAALRGRAIGGLPLDGGGKLAGDACQL